MKHTRLRDKEVLAIVHIVHYNLGYKEHNNENLPSLKIFMLLRRCINPPLDVST